MSFPRYPKYKPSGVEWLGDVPEHWDVSPLKAVATHNDEVLDESTDPEHEILYVDISSVDGVSGISVKEPMPFANAPSRARRRVRDGDVIVSTVRTYLKAIARICDPESNLIASTGFAVIRPRNTLVPHFLGHLISASFFIEQVIARSTGVSYPAINASELVAIPVLVPNKDEQTAIAAFLDRETLKIDALVAEQRRLIELLKEKRQAVISHAVTKGLNPHAPTKPSGIEWLGDVPEHWEVNRLDWICTDINDINHEMPNAVDDGVLFLSAKDLLDDGTLNFETDVKMISEEDFERLSKKIRPRRGDIIYSRIGAALGKARLVETDIRFNISYSCCVVRVIEKIACVRFIRFLLDGEMILTEARMRTKGIGVPDLGLGEIGRFPIPLPPLAEQKSIVSFLQHETGLLTTLLVEAQRGIELLQERRTALISAAVTGKIDVRSFGSKEAV